MRRRPPLVLLVDLVAMVLDRLVLPVLAFALRRWDRHRDGW